MTSNIQIKKVCEHCGNIFTGRATITRYCSRRCNSAAYKKKIKDSKLEEAKRQTRNPVLGKAESEKPFIDNYLPENYMLNINRIKNIEVFREFLTDEEITSLKDIPCGDGTVYRASGFSILTGLRFDAVEILKWNDLYFSAELDA